MSEEQDLLFDFAESASLSEQDFNHQSNRFAKRSRLIDIGKDHAWFFAYVFLLHAICVVLGIALILPGLTSAMKADAGPPGWIPRAYELEEEYGAGDSESKWSGMPNKENTQAWDDLIQPSYFSVNESDLQKTGETVNDSVLLTDGSYIAGLGVYHDIHCLRRLRLFLHSDYYYDNLTETNMKYLRGHLGHCIESLRRSIMCNANTNIYTFTWSDAELVRPGIYRPQPKSNQMRKCVNWNALEDWIMERRTPLKPVLLMPDGIEEKVLM